MQNQKFTCDLKTCFLCKNCGQPWEQLIPIKKVNKRYNKGETIFLEGQKVEGIHFLFSGNVKVYKRWGTKKELIIRFATAGDILGHRGWGTTNNYPVSATALGKVTTCFVPSDFFLSALHINSNLSFELMRFYAEELQQAEDRMRTLTHFESKGRLAIALLDLKDQFGTDKHGHIDIILNRRDIASYAGTTYETLFRIMQEWQNKSIIKITGKRIRILKESSLLKLSLVNE